jgi:hypothetical protein
VIDWRIPSRVVNDDRLSPNAYQTRSPYNPKQCKIAVRCELACPDTHSLCIGVCALMVGQDGRTSWLATAHCKTNLMGALRICFLQVAPARPLPESCRLQGGVPIQSSQAAGEQTDKGLIIFGLPALDLQKSCRTMWCCCLVARGPVGPAKGNTLETMPLDGSRQEKQCKVKRKRKEAREIWISFCLSLPGTWTILASGRETSLDPSACLSFGRREAARSPW